MSEEITPPRPLNVVPSSEAGSDAGPLAELRKEVVEARNLVIKTDNLLKNLHAELKQMGRKQEMFESRHWMTSIVAYVIFTVLIGLGAFSLSRAEIRVAREEASANESKVHQLTQDLEKLRAGEAARREASEKAARVYDLLGTEKEGPGLNQAMSQAVHLDRQLVSSLESKAIDDRAAGMKGRMAQAALDRGNRAFRANDWGTAAQELTRYIELEPKVEDNVVYFRLGNALTQTKDFAKAIAPLETFLKNTGGTKTAQYAGFLLGTAYEETGKADKARAAYERAASLYPGSEFAPMIRNKLRHLSGAAAASTPAAPAETPAQR
ncbi:MAG: tetratricopeptide repeat protein [Myxococcales bacterium]